MLVIINIRLGCGPFVQIQNDFLLVSMGLVLIGWWGGWGQPVLVDSEYLLCYSLATRRFYIPSMSYSHENEDVQKI